MINNKLASDYLHNNSNAILAIQAPFEIFEKPDMFESQNWETSQRL